MAETHPNKARSSLWQTILVPLDFSRPSDAALMYALRLAQASGAILHVCHVVPIPHSLDALYERGFAPPESLMKIYQNARQHIKAITDATPNGNNVPIRPHFSEGDAVKGVLAWATELKPDLIVMGTHGRKGTKRLLLGSVAEAVIRRATCPVLTLRGDVAQAGEVSRKTRST